MSDEKTDDGYRHSKAISALSKLGTSKSEGWAAIREFWEELAKGRIDQIEAADWAQRIAERVVNNVLNSEAKDRPKKALNAIGLVGVEGVHSKERDHVQMFEEFRGFAEKEGHNFLPTRRRFAQQMIEDGYFKDLSIDQAMEAIDYIKKAHSPKNSPLRKN